MRDQRAGETWEPRLLTVGQGCQEVALEGVVCSDLTSRTEVPPRTADCRLQTEDYGLLGAGQEAGGGQTRTVQD